MVFKDTLPTPDIKEVVEVLKTLLVAICLMLCAAPFVFAGANAGAKVAVHVLPYDCQMACTRKFPEITAICQIEDTYDDCGDIHFFPVFFDMVECMGLEYGAVWPGDYSCVYTSCSYAHLGEIVWPGDGTTQIYSECQEGSIVIAGYGWITVNGPGTVCIVSHPTGGGIFTADCDPYVAQLDTVTMSYCAGVCGAPGDDVCKYAGQATVPTTWGSIKGMFR